jgi:hypothetical protein
MIKFLITDRSQYVNPHVYETRIDVGIWKVARALLKHDVDEETRAVNNWSPLGHAFKSLGRGDVVRVLLYYSACCIELQMQIPGTATGRYGAEMWDVAGSFSTMVSIGTR